MIICSRCKTENNESSKFCCQCGNDLTINVDAPANEDLKSLADSLNEQAVHTVKQPFNLNKALSEFPKKIWGCLKKSIFFRKKKNTIITFSSVVLIALLVFGVLNSGYIAFTAAYNMGKYDTAKSIQGWSFNSNGVKSNIEKFVISKTESYYDDFSAEKITYEEANEKFDIAKDFTSNKDAKNKADKLQTSRTSYAKAEEYAKNGDTYNAVIEYQKVIEEDKNYDTAKEQIEKNKPAVKKEAISRMDDCAAVNDFNTGLKIVSDMEKIFTNDSDINNYKKDFEDRKEAHRIQELKDNQKLIVLSSRLSIQHSRWKALYPDLLTAIVKNNSDKTVKEFNIAFLAYDANGLPVKVKSQYSYTDGDYEYNGRNGTANLTPGGTTGYGYGWNIDEDHLSISTVIACVTRATFYDGSIWTNPYYDHWIEQYKGKPLN